MNASSLTMIVAPRSSVAMLAFSAAGFIATRTLGVSPGRQDVARGEVDLEGGDAADRAGGGADLRGEVGQRREVVAEHRGGVREAAAGQLHAVAGVAGEAHDDALAILDVFDA